MVEAIESLFEPVVIYNNQPGKDATILRQFREPSWNYQVVRFLDANGKDLIPRKDKVWTKDALAARMIKALEASKQTVPNYLKGIAGLAATPDVGKAAFAMYCFWTGEMKLGGIDGVLTTEAGWFKGHEVTLVEFDRSKVKFADLVAKAASFDCSRKVYTSTAADKKVVEMTRLASGTLDNSYRVAQKSDQKRQIKSSNLLKLDLTPVQATKVNAFARTEPKQALSWLSPGQIRRLRTM